MTTRVWYLRLETEGTEKAHNDVVRRVLEALQIEEWDEDFEFLGATRDERSWWPDGLKRLQHGGCGIDGKALDKVIEAIRAESRRLVDEIARRV